MKSTRRIFPAHIEINGSKMVRYEYDNHIAKNIRHGKLGGLEEKHRKGEREFANTIFKPRELTPIRNRFNVLKSAKEFCDSLVANLQDIQEKPGCAASGLDKAADKLKDIAISGLSPDQLHQIYSRLTKKRDEAQKASASPIKLNFFASPWIGSPQNDKREQVENRGLAVHNRARDIPAAIRAPGFPARGLEAIRPVQGFTAVTIFIDKYAQI